jgi:hypothetical protein
MNNTLHAPAPWTINRISRWHDGTPKDFDYLEVVSRQGYQLSITNDCKPKSIATANLIAAAPDLFKVVEDYILLCELHDYVGAVPNAARAALRKAKGEA